MEGGSRTHWGAEWGFEGGGAAIETPFLPFVDLEPWAGNFHHSEEGAMAKLVTVEGIGEAYAEKLKGAGVETTQALLEKGSTPAGRQEIAEMAGVSPKLVLEWVNHVDLFRVKGIGEEYADLLEEAGVDTVPELAQRNAENLYQKLQEVNREKKLVRRPPSQAEVSDWVAQAQGLPRKITY